LDISGVNCTAITTKSKILRTKKIAITSIDLDGKNLKMKLESISDKNVTSERKKVALKLALKSSQQRRRI